MLDEHILQFGRRDVLAAADDGVVDHFDAIANRTRRRGRLGLPDDGLAPGTRWEDIPADWTCPDCGAEKADFDMVEVSR
ncbi:rubredoxin [Nocardia sp. NBC_01377]|uniref:rubredoxin n=1 Tax=Nocardia sp. NBC_01377 TaxID=2903595 RepID=UPI00386C530C